MGFLFRVLVCYSSKLCLQTDPLTTQPICCALSSSVGVDLAAQLHLAQPHRLFPYGLAKASLVSPNDAGSMRQWAQFRDTKHSKPDDLYSLITSTAVNGSAAGTRRPVIMFIEDSNDNNSPLRRLRSPYVRLFSIRAHHSEPRPLYAGRWRAFFCA